MGQVPERGEATAGAGIKAPRYGFIDLLRGFAILVMVETHVVNSYLPLDLKKGSEIFFWLAFLNGLVAPSFLFATGFSLILQSNYQWENWVHFRPPFWRQLRRIGFIALVAYYTHLQGFGLNWYLKNRNKAKIWDRTFQVDILQCIVVSLLVVLALILILRKRKLLPWALGILAVGVALTTPWIWSYNFRETLPLPIALFLNPHGVSLFPIFPWIFFVLVGACASHIFLKYADSKIIPQYMKRAACLGIMLIIAGLLLRHVPYALPGVSDFYTTSPLYLMIRLGSVLVICALLYKFESKWMRPVQLAGQESLLVYGLHLWIIYALLRGRYLGPILGKQFGYPMCFLISAVIILLMIYLAGHWHTLKKKYPRQIRWTQGGIIVAMTLGFLLF